MKNQSKIIIENYSGLKKYKLYYYGKYRQRKKSLTENVKPKRHWIPNPKGTEKSAFWRYREDGTYDNKPLSESYFRDYYREKLSHKSECKYCKKEVCMQQMKRHQNTAKCLKIQNKNI